MFLITLLSQKGDYRIIVSFSNYENLWASSRSYKEMKSSLSGILLLNTLNVVNGPFSIKHTQFQCFKRYYKMISYKGIFNTV